MADYIRVKKSQIYLFDATPFFYQAKDGDFALYKVEGERLNRDRLEKTRHPDLFIREADKKLAMAELMECLNMDLAKNIADGGLAKVKNTLETIVQEALTPSQEETLEALPDTVDIVLGAYRKDHGAMSYLSKIASNSPLMVTHSVNVAALTFQYAFFHDLPEEDIRRLGLAALLHDVGCARIDKGLVEKTDRRLTEKEFMTYSSHPVVGHDMIIINTDFDVAVPTVAMEHHERIDGSGYPNGLTQIIQDSQLIGLIDSYEHLTYHEKKFRKAKKPYDSLTLIRDETLKGKFSKDLFRLFASCLVK